MSTAVFFHAHPDDEAIATGGTMARAADEGHRVVLVCATKGEHGADLTGVLAEDEDLVERRESELQDAARILGVARLEYLGYVDSGYFDSPQNRDPKNFYNADVDVAAERLAAILREEDAEVLTTYDENGNYGHLDHIQVHRVGMRASELAETPRVYMSTLNRDYFIRMMPRAKEMGLKMDAEMQEEVKSMGVEESRITTAVDVTDYLDRKRAAMMAHTSQIGEDSFFLSMPPEAAAAVWGIEWYVRVGAEGLEPWEKWLWPE
jgi:LmbE family N-acetylglucosaminyl deacetylase